MIGVLYCREVPYSQSVILSQYFPLSVTVGWKFVVTFYVAMWFIGPILAGTSGDVRGWSSTLALTALIIAMFRRYRGAARQSGSR